MQELGNYQQVPVHFTDLDALGMVHYAYYGVLVERAWIPFWARRGYSRHSPDAFHVIKNLTISYYAPITEVGEVSVELWVNHLGRTSADFGFAIRSADQAVLHAEGRRVCVHLEPQSLRPAPWSDAARDDMSALMRVPDHGDESASFINGA